MNKEDGKEFSDVLNGAMVDIYAREPLSTAGVLVWWNVFKAYSIDEFRTALSGHITDPDSGQYPPKPADVLKRLTGTGDSRAFGAWNRTLSAVKSVGCYRTVIFDDPLIHAVVDDMGGWVAFGRITDDELPFRAAEFQRRYRAYLVAPPASHAPALGGIESLENGRKGYAIAAPVMIGDPHLAALVHQRGCEKRLTLTSAAEILPAAIAMITEK